MTTPEFGSLTFVGASGKRYIVDFYSDDVPTNPVLLDGGSGASATSPNVWKCPERCVLVDMSLATGQTVTKGYVLTADAAIIGGIRLRLANFLNTLAFRPILNVGFNGGTNFGMIEVA